MVFFGHHGLLEEEARLGQRFVVDVELHTDLSAAGASDRLEETMDYRRAYQVVREVMEGPRCRLLEALAERVADGLMAELTPDAVLVRIKKPGVALPGALDFSGVEIVRRRGAS
ncbi:MAG: dihydroneopterin aldolase [Chloroflexi bacterium]|nr:dihydroneopterin aldolase [Chloroflexota bacterium]